ncbi:MAG: hypothetical protein LBJ46_05475 [Planctomycetota bacterium]|nr:hypothetical protein [Planctomycetota bacterium]
MIRVKICCVMTPMEVGIAVRAGVSAHGIVSLMPSGPGVIPLDAVKELDGTGRTHDWRA